jgi:hypothetical protein
VSDATTISVPAAVPNMVTVASFVTKGKDGTPTNDLKIAPGSSKGLISARRSRLRRRANISLRLSRQTRYRQNRPRAIPTDTI